MIHRAKHKHTISNVVNVLIIAAWLTKSSRGAVSNHKPRVEATLIHQEGRHLAVR